MAPDFEYFLRLAPDRGFGHTPKGILELSFPLAILVLWIFHAFVKVPVTGLLPDAIQRRLTAHSQQFRFRGGTRLLLICVSILLGIATHVVWDSFTHPYYWPYRHLPLLREMLRVPLLGLIPYFKLFQHGSTVVGIGILLFWTIRWYQKAEPSIERVTPVSQAKRVVVVSTIASIAVIGAITSAMMGAGITEHSSSAKFVGEAIVTAIALAWWQLVVYGMVVTFNAPRSGRDMPVG